MAQEDSVLGKKRSLANTDTTSTLPEKYSFTFVPRLLPGQKLFDQDQLDTSFDGSHKNSSAAALNYRFRKRASQGRSVQHHPQQQNALARRTSFPMGLMATATTTKSFMNNSNFLTGSDSNESNKSNDNESHIIYARHQAISMTMLNWLQFIFNSVLTVLILYILFIVLWTLRHDFRIKTEEYTAAILDEIALCNRNYGINHCNPSTRVPAMEEKCNYWEACKNRDPLLITRSKLSAEMAAEILNSFVEPISYKTLFFFTVLVIGSLVISNTAFRMYRRRLLLER